MLSPTWPLTMPIHSLLEVLDLLFSSVIAFVDDFSAQPMQTVTEKLRFLFAVSVYHIFLHLIIVTTFFSHFIILAIAQQRPFRMTFKSDENEITLPKVPLMNTPNFASVNELNRVPGGIVGFNLRWTLQSCS